MPLTHRPSAGIAVHFHVVPAPPVVLSIAGYDPSSGAGIAADVKTAAVFGCYAITCITGLTVQSTQGVFAVEPVRAETVRSTLVRLRQDFDISAVRIGMLGSGEVAREVADFLDRERLPIVVLDPILRSSSGAALIDADGLEVLRQRLLRLADLITPNIEEAVILAGLDAAPAGASWHDAEPRIRACAETLIDQGVSGVLITGGQLKESIDFLKVGYSYQLRRPNHLKAAKNAPREQVFQGEHVQSRSTHGTGCALAMAIACLMAQGTDPVAAVGQAKAFVRQAIKSAYPLGKGTGPLNHLYRFSAQAHGEEEPS